MNEKTASPDCPYPIASRARNIPPFIVMDVLEKAQEYEKQGRSVVHLEVGEPDFDTPECIKEASFRAIREGKTHYTHSLGLLELREAVCKHYWLTYRVRLSPDRIVVTSGTSPAMLLIFASLLETDDEVILSDPHYACYPNFISFCNGRPVNVPVVEEEGFQYAPEAIREKLTSRTRAILINSPSNPTGTLLGADRMAEIAAFGIPVISDEIYHGLVYKGKAHSILEFTDRAFVLNGFSKYYAMTGWRLGYVIAPPEFIRPMQKLQQNLFISASAFVQWAGVTALTSCGQCMRQMRNTYDERRLYLLGRLRAMGVGVRVEPTGAFYVLANMKSFDPDSYHLAFDILDKAGVAVTPGIDFGSNAEGYIRFSYANSLENIEEGMNRLERYLKDLASR